MKYQVEVGGRRFEIEVEPNHLVRVNGKALYAHLEQVGGLPLYTLSVDGRSVLAFAEPGRESVLIELKGESYPVVVTPVVPDVQRAAACFEGEPCTVPVAAPLPGRLVSLPAPVGATVDAGQVVAVVESMKMQMQLRAPQAGMVTAHHVQPGAAVAQSEPLLTLQTP